MTKNYLIMLVLNAFCIVSILLASNAGVTVPVDVCRTYLSGDFSGAEQMLRRALNSAENKAERFAMAIELGDLYLDKYRNWRVAESIYSAAVAEFPDAKTIADVYYRLAVCDERQEKYLEAAQGYEKVAIRYQGSTYANDALEAIERCFRKNYQDRVAYVDGFPITRLEFDDIISRTPALYEKFEDKRKLLDQMIDDRLLYAEALRLGLDQTDDFRKQLFEFRRDQMMQAWYDREVVRKVVIHDTMKRNYYREHRNDYITPEQVRTRQIEVKTRHLADSLRLELASGRVPFETLVRAHSVAPDKDRGGDMGFFRRGVRAKEIDEIAFALKPGEVSGVIKTGDSSYTILKLEERRERKERTFEEVAGEIENRLKPQKIQERLNSLLEQLKKTYVVQDSANLLEGREPLAVVVGIPISNQDLNAMLERVPPMYRPQFENQEGKKRLLDQLITERLVLFQAEQNKYWLANDILGQTMDRERQLLIQTVKRLNSTEKVKLDDKEIQQEYKRTLKDFMVPEQVRAKEIVLKDAAEAKAMHRLLTDRKRPVSFDSLARTVSVANSRWASGDMGLLVRGQRPKPIDKVLFSLRPKAISGVIKLNDTTYTIIKVEERKKAYTRPLSEVRPKIERKLRTEAEKKLLSEYLAGLRTRAKIEILLTEESAMPPRLETADTLQLVESKDHGLTETNYVRLEPETATQDTAKPLLSIYFGFDRTDLTPKYRRALDSIAVVIRADSGLQISVIGFADNSGNPVYNRALSQRRAQKVAQYLEKNGIDPKRIEIRTMGAERAKHSVSGQRWRDRRVDIIRR